MTEHTHNIKFAKKTQGFVRLEEPGFLCHGTWGLYGKAGITGLGPILSQLLTSWEVWIISFALAPRHLPTLKEEVSG